MAEWRYLVQRLGGDADGEIFETELPVENFVRGRALSAPPAGGATISHPVARLVAPDGKQLIRKWETAIYPVADDQILGGYIVTSNTYNGDTWDLALAGFSASPKGQPYHGVNEFPGADPMDVFRHVWVHHQEQPGAQLHVAVTDATSSIRLPIAPPAAPEGEQQERDEIYRLNYWSTFDLGAIIDDLTVLGDFDWRERHDWGQAEFPIDHTIELGRPIGGRKHNFRLVYGENVLTEPQMDDGDGFDSFATDIILLGAGEGKDRVRGFAGRPWEGVRRYKVIEDEDVDSAGQADKEARAALARHRGDPRVGAITVVQHDNADLHALEPGDELQYYAETPHVTIDQWVKIIDIKDSPDQGDVAVITVVPT